jgi:phosphoribosylformylglycinamidine synthase
MGGSHFALVTGRSGGTCPKVRPDEAGAIFDGLHRAIAAGTVRACHDLSEGGLAVAVAEMAFAGCRGIDAGIASVPTSVGADGSADPWASDLAVLFSESPSRFLCEVRPADVARFLAALGAVPSAEIGTITDDARVVLRGTGGNVLVDEGIEALREAFTRPLRNGGAR